MLRPLTGVRWPRHEPEHSFTRLLKSWFSVRARYGRRSSPMGNPEPAGRRSYLHDCPEKTAQRPGSIRYLPEKTSQRPGSIRYLPEKTAQRPGSIRYLPEKTAQRPGSIRYLPEKTSQRPGSIRYLPEKTSQRPGSNPYLPEKTSQRPGSNPYLPEKTSFARKSMRSLRVPKPGYGGGRLAPAASILQKGRPRPSSPTGLTPHAA
jgi:hypothetical protein